MKRKIYKIQTNKKYIKNKHRDKVVSAADDSCKGYGTRYSTAESCTNVNSAHDGLLTGNRLSCCELNALLVKEATLEEAEILEVLRLGNRFCSNNYITFYQIKPDP